MIFFYIYWFIGCFLLYMILSNEKHLAEEVIQKCGAFIGCLALLIFTLTYPVAFFPALYKNIGDDDE